MDTIIVLEPIDGKMYPSAEIQLERFDNGYAFGLSVFTRTEGFSWCPNQNDVVSCSKEEALKNSSTSVENL